LEWFISVILVGFNLLPKKCPSFQIERTLFKLSSLVEVYHPEDNAGAEPEFEYSVVHLDKNNHV
jgi:hypothetical protein